MWFCIESCIWIYRPRIHPYVPKYFDPRSPFSSFHCFWKSTLDLTSVVYKHRKCRRIQFSTTPSIPLLVCVYCVQFLLSIFSANVIFVSRYSYTHFSNWREDVVVVLGLFSVELVPHVAALDQLSSDFVASVNSASLDGGLAMRKINIG